MKTRSLYLLAAAGGTALFALAVPQPTSGQTAPASPARSAQTSPQLMALVNEVNAQSRQLAENQAKIDEKLDKIAEAVRQARLFAARTGPKGGAK